MTQNEKDIDQNEVDLHVAKSLEANEHRLNMSNKASGRFFTGGKDRLNGGYYPETTFRFTSEDERIAKGMASVLGASSVADIQYRNLDTIHEVRTKAERLDIVLSGEGSIINNFVRRKKNRVSFISDGTNIIWSQNSSLFNSREIVSDPQSGLSLGDRKNLFKSQDIGAVPESDLYFRLKRGPQHLFRFSSRNWLFYKELNSEKLRDKLKQGDVHATLRIVKNAAYTRVVLSVNS